MKIEREKITSEQFEQKFKEILIEYLKDAGVEVRHKVVCGWNWDAGPDIPIWIIRQADTDKATALRVYWSIEPGYHKQFDREQVLNDIPDWDTDKEALIIFDLVEEIEEKYVSGFYQNSEIAFNPAWDTTYGEERAYDFTAYARKQNVNAVRKIPDIMFEGLDGRKISDPDDWAEGIPPYMGPAFYQKYDIV